MNCWLFMLIDGRGLFFLLTNGHGRHFVITSDDERPTRSQIMCCRVAFMPPSKSQRRR
jgi:hypothetical protein